MLIKCSHSAIVPIHELKQHPKNRNKHPKEQIERLAKILKYQGWRYPIKVSKRSGFITAGHGRLMAALHAGETQVPVDFQDYESDEQEYADVQADNAIASWSELDLQGINLDLGELGPDFDLDLLGIDGFTLDVEKVPLADEDEIPEKVEPKAKLGDIYKLGNHRLMCGDATSSDAVLTLMEGYKADMVFTDPPYNTGMKAKKDSQAPTWLGHMFDDDFTDEEWAALLSGMCASYWMATKDSAALYICLDWRRSHELVPEIKKLFKFSNLIIWDKMVHGLGSDYKYTHEFIHVCKKGDPVLETNHGEKDYQDIWHIQRKIGRDDEHATKKPIEIVERAITHASKQGGSVLDLFGGSGSTLIACEKTGRKCFMSELDPKYVDVIVNRWMKYSGKEAFLVEDSSGKLREPVPYAKLDSFRGESILEEPKSTAQRDAGQSEGHTEGQYV